MNIHNSDEEEEEKAAKNEPSLEIEFANANHEM